jgi:hypothetical protein
MAVRPFLLFPLLPISSCAQLQVMTGPFPDMTVLNSPDCGLPGPTPGTRSPQCVVSSLQAAAAPCAAACLGDTGCTAYTWHANTTDNGPWALACIFRTDGAWLPEYGATDHSSGQKVVPAPPLVWPVNDGYDALPTMWFGANSSGLDSQSTLALISRFRLGTYGWQQGTGALAPGQNLGQGDAFLAAAATHLSDFLDAAGHAGANRTRVGIYRQVQVALRLFAAPRTAADNPLDADFWMRDAASGTVCVAGQPWGTSDPFWNFSIPAAADYWVAEAIAPLAAEAFGTYSTVFFDESDQNFCGYWAQAQDNCGAQPLAAIAQMHASNNAVLARTAATLNAARIIPVFSSLNVMAAAGAGLGPGAPPPPCALPEDATLAAMGNATFARFYENFPYTWWAPGGQGPDEAALLVANAILEGAAGVPLVLHFDVTACPADARNITRPGRLGGDIELQLATFLVVQTPQTVFSISGNWYDADYCWRSEFDVRYGRPLAAAVRTGSHTWARNFTRSQVTLDVLAGTGEVLLLE